MAYTVLNTDAKSGEYSYETVLCAFQLCRYSGRHGFQNMAMKTQFAEGLNVPGLLNLPVTDATGLAGAFDFTLSYSPVGLGRAGGRGGPAQGDGAAVAPEPDGGLTLFEAIEQQLGLKLVEEKASAARPRDRSRRFQTDGELSCEKPGTFFIPANRC